MNPDTENERDDDTATEQGASESAEKLPAAPADDGEALGATAEHSDSTA